MVLGLSGGLDSTLALLVAAKCCDILDLPRSTICSVTMPGFGTSSRTKGNAEIIAEKTGSELRTIPINAAVEQHFKDIGHDPENKNVVYENSQARERTQILMDIANEINGIVVGTGDLSEIALGWSTFNGDHMSMYCVNCDVPKTLMRSMVEFAATESDEKLAASLRDICNTPVSPELLPGAQHTENIIGSYELHDFFLYYLLRYGEEPRQLFNLACKVFAGTFEAEEIKRTLDIFIRRFFTQQFKRNAAPEGPRTNTVSLGAKSDWRMPSDSSFALWKR
jgi:NAD+ synthase (glutamine-hydrolysing)